MNRPIKMLTANQLQSMPPGCIFATGVEEKRIGLNILAPTREVRWVAKRGEGFHDWAIYWDFAEFDTDYIARYGDKVSSENHIKKLVPCDDDAFKLYRE